MQLNQCLLLPRRLAISACGLIFFLSASGLFALTNASCPTCVLDYPYTSTNPRTSIAFNESEILRAFSTNVAGRGNTIRAWYSDEHALTLGIRQVVVKTSAGSVTNNYPITGMTNNPSKAIRPMVGSTAMN